MLDDKNLNTANELLEAIHFFNKKGWSPATSTNYSAKAANPEQIIISRSGVDKSRFSLSDLILVNLNGEIHPEFKRNGVKSSAETEIHTALYAKFPDIGCVLHTHSVLGTVLSIKYAAKGSLQFTGYEILKGLEGNTTHQLTEALPIVPNSQKMSDIIDNMEEHFSSPNSNHGFLIEGHGLYTWGKDIATAKRQIETFEFLFECEQIMRRS